MANIVELLNRDLDQLVAGVWRSLVQVRNGTGAGAGTVWHPDGLIVTNAHVLGAHGLSVVLGDGRSLPARVIAADRSHDVAALVVEASGLDTIALGDSHAVVPGQWVVAIGHPWGVTGAATAGIVTASGPALPEMPGEGLEWIATDLHLRPGHSGGPLVDSEGRLIGINTIMAGPNVGLAVPVHVIKAFLKEALGSRRARAA